MAFFERVTTAAGAAFATATAFLIEAMEAYALMTIIGAQQAQAIPSPELIVGSVSSLSQVGAWIWALAAGALGMLGVGLGRRKASQGQSGTGRARRWLLVALLLGAIVSAVLNVYQYTGAASEKQARLQETLLRPSRQPQGSQKDPDMKEINFGEQLKHPMALSTSQTAALLQQARSGERKDLVFLDVREGAEREMGTIPGVTFVRFPDLKLTSSDFAGKKAVLFCHNGNRSSETCEALKKLGIDCGFMAGGLEKWVVEGREIDGLGNRSLRDLRAIPPYKNRETLLDTADVKRLLKEKKAAFVDIRYPTDFAEQHLPEAINLSLRRMSTPELQQRIDELPRRPIILPCYDRRGCFFAEVLGYELSKAGHEVLGRYTVPWEYFVVRPRPPHVVKWIEDNEKSISVRASENLSNALVWLSKGTGLVTAILFLAILSRLLVLPFALKAERDQLVLQKLKDEVRDMKKRLRGDPVRFARAMRTFNRKHGLTPMRNLSATLFIPVLAVALGGVERASASATSGFLWIPNLGKADGTYILPVMFAALLACYLDWAFGRGVRQRLIMAAVTLAAGTWLAAQFNAGSVLYLVASGVLLLMQRLAVAIRGTGNALAGPVPALPEGAISLNEVQSLIGQGAKAYNLARLKAAGLPVPDGVLLTEPFLARLSNAAPSQRQQLLDGVRRALAGGALAVRSCASVEDGAAKSYAGVFDSVLHVQPDELETAIARVRESFTSARAKHYGDREAVAGVLVQRMVNAGYAGVLFTRSPAEGALAMVELVKGTAERMVSGAEQPQTFRLGRLTGVCFDAEPPIALDGLLSIGRIAETVLATPQDVEWCWDDGFWVVQSRPITTPLSMVQDSLAQAVLMVPDGVQPSTVVLARNELSEMLPTPTPLSLSLMEAFWKSGGSVDLACRRLGLAYPVEEDAPPYLVSVLGRLYVNKAQEDARALSVSSLAAARLGRRAKQIERNFRDSFLPSFLSEMRVLDAMDFRRLPLDDLRRSLIERLEHYLLITHVEVDIVNVAASVLLSQATEQLRAQELDPSAILGSIPSTFESSAYLAAQAAQPEQGRAILMDAIGHRSLVDYELAEPRYSESPGLFEDPMRSFTAFALSRRSATQSATEHLARAAEHGPVVERALRFQTLKQDARHHSLRELSVIRQILLAIDSRLDMQGMVFFLTLDELAALSGASAAELNALACSRHAAHQAVLQSAPLAPSLAALDLERASAGQLAAGETQAGRIQGTRVSGIGGPLEGRICRVDGTDADGAIPGFEDGDIVVAPMISPHWVQYFGRASGFIAEVGGWLSHTAILAREHRVTLIVGAAGACRIEPGSRVRLHADGTVEVIDAQMATAADAAVAITS